MESIIIHDNYNETTLDHDLCLLTLQEEVQMAQTPPHSYYSNMILRPQLFAKYMFARLNSRQLCTSTFTLFDCFWLSQGVYPGYTFGYPPKSGGNG